MADSPSRLCASEEPGEDREGERQLEPSASQSVSLDDGKWK